VTEKALIIKGPIGDLRELLKIAVVEGKKVLKVQQVKVKPVVFPYGNGNYLVVVEPNGCDGALDVEGGRKRKEP